MAIISTGAIYKSLVFDGESSRDYGIYITGQAVYNAPERDVEMINIPGRNGSFALDKGRFQNIEVTYPAGIFADNEADFAQGISDFRNFLCSRNGYVRLTDDYNPDEYRMAVYKRGLDVSPAQLKAGEFKIVFDCKPQRYLLSGEEPVTIGEWHETETASGEIASFEAKAGDAVKSLVADIEPIQSLNGYDKPWSGGAGKNKLNCLVATIKSKNSGGTWSGNDYTFRGVTYTLNSADGTVVDSIKAVGTASGGNAYLLVGFGNVADSLSLVSGTQYIVSNGASAGTVSYYDGSSSHTGNQSYTFTWGGNSDANFTVGVASGSTVNTVYYPMIRLSSVSDATYEPYSNICPISGYDSVVVSRCGKNLLPYPYYNTSRTHNGVTWTVNADGTITANGTATSESQFILTGSVDGDDYVGKIFSALTRSSGTPWKIRALIQLYGSPWTTIDADYGRGVTVPNTASGINIRFLLCIRSGETVTNEVFKPMIRLASETDATYEPYQGNTYTINLNGTRYGGTLDVASGVLTVDRAMVDLGDFTWSSFHSPTTDYFYSNALSDYKYIDSDTINYLCSAYESISGNQQRTNGTLRIASTKSITIQDLNYTSASAFKTAVTGQTLCYELATPTTVQLTAQEVELLVGLNQIWANSGDVSVEYGTRPSAVYNPTLFESSPMLEVTGYGEIGIGDDTIVVNDTPIGDIYISEGGTITRRDNELSITLPITFETRDLNGGDKFYISDATAAIQSTVKSGYTTDGCSASSFDTAATTNATGTSKALRMKYSMIFIYNEGTLPAQSDSNTATFFDRWTHGGAAGSNSAIFTISGSYTGGNTLTLTLTIQLSECFDNLTVKSLTLPRVRAKSTKSALGTPTYIDLDIGEAWNADSGEPVSANNAVIFPSTLPTLKPGMTEFSLPGSVTDLKVVPRFWKI